MRYVYFAYGSCMNKDDFLSTCPSGVQLFNDAVLPDYRLRFDGFSATRLGGVANVRLRKNDAVRGVLWAINSAKDIKALDRREGAPLFYRRIPITVMVGRHEVTAFTYELVHPCFNEYAPDFYYSELIQSSIENKKYYHKVDRHIARLERKEKESAAYYEDSWLDYTDWRTPLQSKKGYVPYRENSWEDDHYAI